LGADRRMRAIQEDLLETDHAALRERVRGFAATEVEPHAARIDREAEFPREVYRRAAGEGLVGFTRPEGAGGDALGWALAMEELAAASATVADVILLSEMLALILDKAGSERQRELLGPLMRGETLGAFALTEPNAGSDAAAIETRAEREGDSYVLTGTKSYINNASVADWAVVLAKTDPEAGTRGITAFLVERGGFSSGEPYDLMGQRGIAVGELYLEGARVSGGAVVGQLGDGFGLAMRALDLGRIGVGAMAVGIARAAFEAAADYAGRRVQFGRPISSFQGLRWMLADMATDIEAARLLVHRAARLRDAGLSYTREAAMAKMRASDTAMSVTLDALQVHGGTGYRKDLPVERYVRDAKITQIYEGTNQILRQVIARETLG
jgi:alkylation response protein AidB-like acyl-CoA dehydrogenase